jgi:hypothetical protein
MLGQATSWRPWELVLRLFTNLQSQVKQLEYTCLIVVHNKNMEKHSVLSVLPEVYNFIFACTADVRCMYYAIVH